MLTATGQGVVSCFYLENIKLRQKSHSSNILNKLTKKEKEERKVMFLCDLVQNQQIQKLVRSNLVRDQTN